MKRDVAGLAVVAVESVAGRRYHCRQEGKRDRRCRQRFWQRRRKRVVFQGRFAEGFGTRCPMLGIRGKAFAVCIFGTAVMYNDISVAEHEYGYGEEVVH